MAAHTDQRTAHHPPLARLNVQGRDVASGPHRFVPFTDPGPLSEARNGTIYVPLVEVIAAPHPTFYYPDGDISFIVKNTEYKVHYAALETRAQDLSRSALVYPYGPTQEFPKYPILLPLDPQEFDQFLSFFYMPGPRALNPLGPLEWLRLFYFAKAWNFPSVMETAIHCFEALALPLDKITYGHQYGVEEWYMSGYKYLCLRPDPLLPGEIAQLTSHDTALIARIREERMRGGPGSDRLTDPETLSRYIRANLTPCTVQHLQRVRGDISDVERDEIDETDNNSDSEVDEIDPESEAE